MALPDYTSTGNADYRAYSYRQYRKTKPDDPMGRGTYRKYNKGYQPTQPNPTVTQDPGYQGQVTEPQYDNSHPFYDPNSNYAHTGYAYGQLPGWGNPGNDAANMWAEDNPDAYYYSVMNERGLGGMDARSQAAQGMYKDAMMGYKAAHTKNMELRLPQYLAGWDPNTALNQMSNEQLGIDESRFRGRDRWGMRGGL